MRAFDFVRLAPHFAQNDKYGRFAFKATVGVSLYNLHMMDELEFRKRSDEAFAALKKSLFAAEDDADIEVEDQSGALHISFEDGARFVVSPNAPVRQIWISALTTSFKLDWSDAGQDFVLVKTGEKLKPLVGRLVSQQLGEAVELK